MTVDELRKAIKDAHGTLTVEISLPNDEFPATVVTKDGLYLRICQSNAEIPVGETVLHDDAEAGE